MQAAKARKNDNKFQGCDHSAFLDGGQHSATTTCLLGARFERGENCSKRPARGLTWHSQSKSRIPNTCWKSIGTSLPRKVNASRHRFWPPPVTFISCAGYWSLAWTKANLTALPVRHVDNTQRSFAEPHAVKRKNNVPRQCIWLRIHETQATILLVGRRCILAACETMRLSFVRSLALPHLAH